MRVAITGISAIVDANGRVLQKLPLLTAGVLDAELPAAIPATPYASHGNNILLFQLLVALALLVIFDLAERRL